MKHTELPWEVLREADGAIATGNKAFPHVTVVRYSDNPALSVETGKANAAHIVKCVNLHEELVTRLHEAQQRLLALIGDCAFTQSVAEALQKACGKE